MMDIRQLRIEAAQAGIPLLTILSKAKINRKTYYSWMTGVYSPTNESLERLERAVNAARKIRETLDGISTP